MNRLIAWLLILTAYTTAAAQPYGNEWIDYNKTYYKCKVGATGLYRITQATLAAAGIADADATQFQLWRNGQEVPLYTSVAAGPLNASGYIEFWGMMNDGKADVPLYRVADHQLSDKWSLFTDTAAYFLTLNPAGTNKRLLPTANTIPAGVSPEPYFIHTVGKYYKDQIHLGYPQGSGSDALYSSSYEYGEGWASTAIGNNETLSYTENNLFAYTGAGAPAVQIKMSVAGDAPNTRQAQLTLNGSTIFDNSLVAYNFLKLRTTASPSLLSGHTAAFVVTNSTAASSIDRIKVAALELSYPRSFNFGGSSNFQFELPAKASGTYLEISGFNFSGTPILYDVNNGKRYEVDATNPALLKVFLQPAPLTQQLVLVSQSAANIKSIAPLQSTRFTNYLQADNQGDYLIITNNAIRYDGSGGQPVEAYSAYRSSAAGGGFTAKIYMADQLIDQFAFGIKNHTSGIRNFIHWARSKYSRPLQFVFLIGKGVSYYWARNNESNPLIAQLNMVPTFGYPASDILLTATGSSSLPLTPIGRISVINGNELAAYLTKVKEYEQGYTAVNGTIADQLWKKNVLHVVGADDGPTINTLYSYLNQHKKIIQDTLYGSAVTDFVKGATGGEQQLYAERLTRLMDSGIGMLTYFGHASTTTLAFNLENPQNYNNKGKYPVFNMLGCNVGDIFGLETGRPFSVETVSEKYLLAKDRGAIAMMAGTSLGYITPLEEYNRNFYTQLSTTSYGKSLAECMNATIKNIFDKNTENALLLRSQCETFALNGDPALKLYQQQKPDYAIEDASVLVNPSFVSVAEQSFSVKAKIANLGKALPKKIVVELKRTFPDLSVAVFRRDTIEGIRYMDSLQYELPIDPIKDKGLNRLSITIDPDNAVDELYKNNNTITKDIQIYENEIRPVYPYDEAIVNSSTVKFMASTANPFTASQNYIFEIDTSRLFNTAAKISQTKNAPGGIVEFTPTATYKNNQVYYWRVAAAPAAGEAPKWNDASFLYLTGTATGFNQSHTYQFLNNTYSALHATGNGNFVFDEQKASLNITSAIFPYGTQASNYKLTINDSMVANSWIAPFEAQTNSLRFYIIDNKRMQVMKNQDLGTTGLYGSYRPVPYYAFAHPNYFQFDISTTAARETVMKFLDAIPDKYYVIATNSIYAATVLPAVWQSDTALLGTGKSLYHTFLQMGAGRIGEVNDFVPFIFLMQKGTHAALLQEIATLPSQLLSVNTLVPTLAYKGSMETRPVGPAKQWQKVMYTGSAEQPYKEEVNVAIIGIKKDGTQTVLLDNIAAGANGADISFIDAAIYPKLKLRMSTLDSVNSTPYQLSQWQLLYTPAPEGAVAPNIYFKGKDTLEAGEPLHIGIAFKNISDYSFDPLQVKVAVRNKNNIETIIPVPVQKALPAGDTILLNVPVSTASYGGSNTLLVTFNPNGEQPEQYAFNNFVYKNFYVRSDTLNPYLDVTFDGVHILNRDIVSGKPDIVAKLTDDAQWLLLNNADLVKVQLRHPDGSLKNYTFTSDTLQFIPATQGGAGNNTATVHFKPHLTADGNYELLIAAKDQSGNQAGNIQYRVAFQVINKPMISNLLNYPNPFTTSTAFVFTLTGSEVPQNMRIQILTITGKVVKEITKAELGPLRIGRNITEYKWDGTDQYGQQLANGVYIYRVITNLNGKSLEKYQTENDNTDKYFNKGYGKMYLMR